MLYPCSHYVQLMDSTHCLRFLRPSFYRTSKKWKTTKSESIHVFYEMLEHTCDTDDKKWGRTAKHSDVYQYAGVLACSAEAATPSTPFPWGALQPPPEAEKLRVWALSLFKIQKLVPNLASVTARINVFRLLTTRKNGYCSGLGTGKKVLFQRVSDEAALGEWIRAT